MASVILTKEFFDFWSWLWTQGFSRWKSPWSESKFVACESRLCDQFLEKCASNFACIGVNVRVIYREAIWGKTIEPDGVSSYIGSPMRSDSFNRRGYIVSSGKVLWVNNHRFSRKTATITVVSNPMENDTSLFLDERSAREWRDSDCRAEQAKSGDQKSRNPESQKARTPGI